MRQLWREIRDQGYSASDMSLRRLNVLLSTWRLPVPQPGVAGTPVAPKEEAIFYSTHKTRWLLLKAPEDLSAREAAYIAALTHLCPPIAEAQRMLTAFCDLLTARYEEGEASLDPWLEQCEQSGISELVGFARGLRRDYAAVRAAIRYAWSQGPVEGHINRLKLLKRQMYGRASFALLRRRVLPDLMHPP